jgi:hypothetical protein
MASISVPLAAALATIALFLAGCGKGSGDSKTYACSNTEIKFATQSFSGSATVSASLTMNGATKTKNFGGQAITVGVKMDFDKLNVREDTSATVTVNGTTADVKVKAFVSIEKKLLAFDLEATVDGNKMSKCAYVDLSKVTTSQQLAKSRYSLHSPNKC